MAKERIKIPYRVTLPNELQLKGLTKARYLEIAPGRITSAYSPEDAVRSVVTDNNNFIRGAIMSALNRISKNNIGIYATPLKPRSGHQGTSNDLSRVVINSKEGEQLTLF